MPCNHTLDPSTQKKKKKKKKNRASCIEESKLPFTCILIPSHFHLLLSFGTLTLIPIPPINTPTVTPQTHHTNNTHKAISKNTTPYLMARVSIVVCIVFLVFVTGVRCRDILGGRTKIDDVGSNQEVQDLGRYAVEEFNKGVQQSVYAAAAKGRALEFREVVEAEKQVVAGIKYYLTVDAAEQGNGGAKRTFDAVVVVQPWLHSKKLLSFAPSTN
ncbi:hypothetical protein Droror1_Dr00009701 [Drosera rotundifolia]